MDEVKWSHCQVGHQRHDRKIVTRQTGLYRGINMPHTAEWFQIYDWSKYMDTTEEYCTGQDVISQEIDQAGVWELAESRIFIDLVKHGGLVLDVGCQLGWYGHIADRFGCVVMAYDANAENVELATRNIGQTPVCTVVGPDTLPLPRLDIRCVKVDIEGAEQYAVDMLAASFTAGTVHSALMEISPIFNGSYRALMRRMDEWGYDAWQIRRDMTGLGDILATPVLDWRSWLGTIRQADVLFMRR